MDEFVKRFYREFFDWAAPYVVHGGPPVEEIAQQAILQGLSSPRRHDPLPDDSEWRAYFKTIIRNLAGSRAKKVRKVNCLVREYAASAAPRLAADAGDPLGQIVDAEESRQIYVALAQMPPDQAAVLILRDFEGKKFGKIAELLGRGSPGSAHNLYTQAKNALADRLGS